MHVGTRICYIFTKGDEIQPHTTSLGEIESPSISQEDRILNHQMKFKLTTQVYQKKAILDEIQCRKGKSTDVIHVLVPGI